MGSEMSSEASGKITRTSSLKEISAPAGKTEASNAQSYAPAKPVKRSSTFSGVGRPQIVRRVKKKSKQNSTVDEHREAFVNISKDEDLRIDVTDGPTKGAEDTFAETGKQNRAGSTEESLFVPTKRSSSVKHSPSLSHKSLELSTETPPRRSPTPTNLPSNKSSPGTFGMGASPSAHRRRSPSSDRGMSPVRRHSSNLMDEDRNRRRSPSQRRSETDEEEMPGTGSKHYNRDNSSADEEYKPKHSNITRTKSAEKGVCNKKKLSRSKSLGSPPGLVALMEEGTDQDLDGKQRRIEASTSSQTKSLERISKSSEKIADSNRRREQHVQRAAYFSAMLKEAKQKENRVRSHDLSSYGQEVLTGVASPPKTPIRSRRHLRQNQYFDTWIKEQSSRIDDLSQAIRGNELKMNQLRSSFRTRDNKMSAAMKLPARPHTDNLPRRRFPSSSTSLKYMSDTDDEVDASIRINKRSCRNDYEELYTQTSSYSEDTVVKRQLSDTLTLLKDYFNKSKGTDPPQESEGRSAESSTHSSIAYHTGDSNLFLSETDIVEKVTFSIGDDSSPPSKQKIESLI